MLQATEALVNSAAGYKLLPKYNQLNKAKKTLIPAFEVTEDGKDVIVPLQDLLNTGGISASRSRNTLTYVIILVWT